MFFSEQGGWGHSPPRPLVVGLILLFLFFSFSHDRSTPRTGSSVARAGVRTGELKEGVKQKIIYDLSLDNERLVQELQQLKQYVLDVRRAARGCGCPLNDTVLTLYPELGLSITQLAAAEAAAGTQQQQQQQQGLAGAASGGASGGSGGEEATEGEALLVGEVGGSDGAAARQAGLAAGGALAAGARRLAAAAGSFAASHILRRDTGAPEAG